MHAHRPAAIGTLLVAAWLTGACTSPVRPTAQSTPSLVPPASDIVLSVTGLVFEAPAEPGADPMPVAGATINAIVDPAGYPLSVVTDANGWFIVSAVKGTVTITVVKDGYETLVRSVSVDEDTRLDFELKRAE